MGQPGVVYGLEREHVPTQTRKKAVSTLLVKNADLVVMMDDDRTEIGNCDVAVKDKAIDSVGPNLDFKADETIDATGCLVIPGLINTHNHMWGSLYRALPEIQDQLWDEWARQFALLWTDNPVTPDAVYTAALANGGKHLLTGCTTSADHHWVYREGVPKNYFDRSIDAAVELGMRFHPGRGCMTLGQDKGGLVPDMLLESETDVLEHSQELIDKYHDPERYSMVRVHLSPTAVYSDTETIFKEMRALAQQHDGVTNHVHIYQGNSDERMEGIYGISAMEFLEKCGWEGPDVIYYHFDTDKPDELKRVSEAGTWVSICISVDMRMGFCGPSGPSLPAVRELLELGGNVCFGTTNPANNEGRGMIDDMRVALLAQRMRHDEPKDWITARDVLWFATKQAARGLGRDDLGSLEPGMCADMAIFDTTKIDMAGHHDPVKFLTGHSGYTKATIVNGEVVARDGRLTRVDQDEIADEMNAWARRLVPR